VGASEGWRVWRGFDKNGGARTDDWERTDWERAAARVAGAGLRRALTLHCWSSLGEGFVCIPAHASGLPLGDAVGRHSQPRPAPEG
jgi:hypothetical protein